MARTTTAAAGKPPAPPKPPTAVAAPAPEPTPGAGLTGRLDFTRILPERSVADILAGQLKLRLGGQAYVLPVLSIAKNRQWKADLEGGLAGVLGTLETAGDDMGTIMGILSGATDKLLDLLYAYDVTHVLPARADLEEVANEGQVLGAVLEVWAAANPLVGLALGAMREVEQTADQSPTGLPAPTNSAQPNTTGHPLS